MGRTINELGCREQENYSNESENQGRQEGNSSYFTAPEIGISVIPLQSEREVPKDMMDCDQVGGRSRFADADVFQERLFAEIRLPISIGSRGVGHGVFCTVVRLVNVQNREGFCTD